ncbi:MAG TPA: sulfite exporter TauE/SafE family protein, partial [Terriglobales bacterium]|nr:sulfite exporter TauE/SafE family protein [Terriglobales bacterium]
VQFAGPAATAAFELLLGAAIGVLAGFMGVGGGILAVPAFTLVLGMTQAMGQGTSLAVILVTAPAGAIEHHRHGNVVLWVVPGLAVGAALGGPLASVVAHHLPQAVLARAFAVFLLASAVHLWLRSGRARPGPDGGRGAGIPASPPPQRNP